MSKVDGNDLKYFKEACDKTYATSSGADANGIVQQRVNEKNVYPQTKAEAVFMPDGKKLSDQEYICDAPKDDKQYARKNGAWIEVEGGSSVSESINVHIESNTSNTADLNGIKVTLTNNTSGKEETKVWEGSDLAFSAPMMCDCTISFSKVTGYATPSDVTFTTVAENSRSITAIYKTCNLSVNMTTNQNSHADIANAKATVTYSEDGTNKTATLASGESVMIPYGTTGIGIVWTAINGYATPAAVTGLACSQDSVTKSVTYNATVLTVKAITNQSSHTDINGATCTVAASGMDTVTLSSGGSTKVPTGANCTITWSAIADYKAPTETFTASGTSQTKTSTYQTELVTVTVTTEDGTSVAGQVITINGKSHTLTAAGTCTQKVAFGVNYNITANAKTNYTTPTSITNRTASQASYSVAMDYKLANETLTVNVSGLASGFTITVKDNKGTVLGTSTSKTKTFSIAKGTVYYVYASSVSGYIVTESFGPYTAVAGSSKTVSVTYTYRPGTTNPGNGVYIKDTEGYYHAADAWDGTYTADCVAVITSNCRFGIALTEASSTMQIHSSYSGSLENYMTAISDEAKAKADYDGATNTANIMKLQSSTSYAAGWCNAFSFPSGKKGFLPSLGQMWAAYSNKSAVDAALIKAGGSALTSAYYWTSTFWGVASSDRSCWLLRWSDGSVSSYGLLDRNYRVRAFSAL